MIMHFLCEKHQEDIFALKKRHFGVLTLDLLPSQPTFRVQETDSKKESF